jgi:hypothetical protein
MADKDKLLREHLVYLLRDGGAHAKFDDVVADFPVELRGKKVKNLPYSAWMLLEHMRLAQWDILEFSRNKNMCPRRGPKDIGRKRQILQMQPRGRRVCGNFTKI